MIFNVLVDSVQILSAYEMRLGGVSGRRYVKVRWQNWNHTDHAKPYPDVVAYSPESPDLSMNALYKVE